MATKDDGFTKAKQIYSYQNQITTMLEDFNSLLKYKRFYNLTPTVLKFKDTNYKFNDRISKLQEKTFSILGKEQKLDLTDYKKYNLIGPRTIYMKSRMIKNKSDQSSIRNELYKIHKDIKPFLAEIKNIYKKYFKKLPPVEKVQTKPIFVVWFIDKKKKANKTKAKKK